MKRVILQTVAGLLAAVLLLSVPCFANSADSAILLDAETGRVLYEKNADKRSLIASTTKIMTGLVVCERCNVLDRMKIPKEAVGIEGSSMYLQEGEVLTIQELLYGMMLSSGNDAAVALAIYCGGTVADFAELMNDRARSLGMKNTHFVNPNGLDAPEHYSCARDLAILAAYAMENPVFASTVSTKTVTVGNRVLKNHNRLLWSVDGADGVKTGYTKAAGRILVSSASRDGRRLIAVTINDGNDWLDHTTLLEDGFSHYSVKTLVSAGQKLGTVEVEGGMKNTMDLIAGEDFSFSLREEEHPEILLSGPGFCYAPISAGQRAGTAYILIDGKVVGRIPTVYAETVEKKPEEKRHFWSIFRKERYDRETAENTGIPEHSLPQSG